MSNFTRLAASATLVLFALSLHSQTGQYSLGTFDSLGPDIINVGNLNVMLDVPVLHKAGRAGTNFTYDLFYNGPIWTPTAGAWAPDSNWGWVGNTQVVTGSLTELVTTSSCRLGSRNIPSGISKTSQVVYHDRFGISHGFRGSDQMNICTNTETDTLNGTWSIDHLYYYSAGKITDTKGLIFNPPVNTPTAAAS